MTRHDDKGGSASHAAESQDRKVSTRQEYAIQLLLQGLKVADVARLVGVRQAQVRAKTSASQSKPRRAG